ncbi:hypothetical protein R1sor_007448 [Riccia sorocarpa]|uniref:Uncharacterized protein n=1 Tax=Riccia sorocarpa TaxID=122646 RepID=A0ABD3HQI2_9MARC
MAPHTGVRNQTWWKTPWVCEKELGIFAKASDVAVSPKDTEVEECDGKVADPNGTDNLPRADGVPVCILDIGFDCAVLFDIEGKSRSTRSKRGRNNLTESNDVWIGSAQKIRRKYNGKWGKIRQEIDLLDRPVPVSGEGSSCQVLFNWYSPLRNNREKFTYDHTDLQWIDLESVISVVRMKVEHDVRTVWCLEPNDRTRVNEFVQSL